MFYTCHRAKASMDKNLNPRNLWALNIHPHSFSLPSHLPTPPPTSARPMDTFVPVSPLKAWRCTDSAGSAEVARPLLAHVYITRLPHAATPSPRVPPRYPHTHLQPTHSPDAARVTVTRLSIFFLLSFARRR